MNANAFRSYKTNNLSIATTLMDAKVGNESKRLINRARWRGYGPATVLYTESVVCDDFLWERSLNCHVL